MDLIDIESWKKAYLAVIKNIAPSLNDKIIRSIYFGGGTPSLLPGSFIKDVLKEIKAHWKLEDNAEISIEINPGTVSEEKLYELRDAGINRASVGVQSMHDDGLVILGRKHDVATSVETVNLSLKLFNSVSIDMIYARPGHTYDIWKDELDLAVGLGVQHLSLYQLIVEDETIFGNMYKRGELLLPDEDTCDDLFDMTQEVVSKAGYEQYEVSNHAKPGFEGKHNIGYWLYNDYIGIGPGAHGRLTMNGEKFALVQEANPKKWLKSIIDQKHILEEKVLLSQEEQAREALLVGLRMRNGVDCSKLPLELKDCVDCKILKKLMDEGYLLFDNNILKGTESGIKCLNAITSLLLR